MQVCTGVMLHGYPLVKKLCGELQTFMTRHGFNSIADFTGASLPYFTTHRQLVALQREALDHKKKARSLLCCLQCLPPQDRARVAWLDRCRACGAAAALTGG